MNLVVNKQALLLFLLLPLIILDLFLLLIIEEVLQNLQDIGQDQQPETYILHRCVPRAEQS